MKSAIVSRPYKKYAPNDADYILSTDRQRIVDIAIELNRPLLVEGESGCGKTQLATSIATTLGLKGSPQKISVKSTTRARDLLYRFDALRRLQDSQINDKKYSEKAKKIYNYISLQTLGRAIFEGEPTVVLIDEIDKADIDFPNDLLDVLEKFEFTIEDMPTQESDEAERSVQGFGRHVTIKGGVPPIVIITSNGEKRLPEPFLRRCLFLELEFPSESSQLAKVVEINLKQKLIDVNQELLEKGVEAFIRVRQLAAKRGVQKPPATSELIDWMHALHFRTTSEPIIGLRPQFWELLFKSREDLASYRTASASEGQDVQT